MAKARTQGFRLLPSYYEAIRDLPDQERLQIYDALMDYGFGNAVQGLPPSIQGYFRLIQPSLDKSIKFEIKQKENGAKGGRPPKNQNITQQKPKPDLGFENENLAFALDLAVDNDLAVEIERAIEEGGADKPPRSPRFIPPTVEEVRGYCLERGNKVNPQHFVDFYASKGWKVGNQGMRDWRAAVRTWEGREKANEPQAPNRTYDIEEVEAMSRFDVLEDDDDGFEDF